MGVLVASRLPSTYESEAALLVGPVSGDHDTLRASGAQARTYAELATKNVIVSGAARRVGLSPESLKSKVESVTASDVTRLLTIRVHDGDPGRAAAVANALADELVDFASQGGGLAPRAQRLEIVDRATPSAEAVGPSAGLVVPLAALAGLLGALGLAAIADSLSTVVRNEQELAALAPVAVLGSVDRTRAHGSGRLVVEADSNSEAAATYRLLATKIELSNGARPLRSILVVDAHRGRSSVPLAANLAGALAEGGARVALLDNGDTDDLAVLYGLSEAGSPDGRIQRGRPMRAGRLTLERFRVKGSRLTILQPREPLESLDLDQASEVLERVLADADVAVLIVPPLDRSPNSLVWSRAAEATLLVTERDHTRREQVPAAVDSLRLAGANVIGTVLCRDRSF
jgi:polysaccharide biosynthesis transport protein